ncbi:MAG: hypothetical protein ACLPXB_05945 [Thiobacillaceae bacterium]
MQIVKSLSAVSILLAAGALSLMVPQISVAGEMHHPGQGYDAFHSGSGEPLPTYDHAYMGTSMKAAPNQGFDIYHLGAVGTVPANYEGTSMMPTPGQGWDVFRSGIGDRI